MARAKVVQIGTKKTTTRPRKAAAPAPQPMTLVESVDAAIAAMEWLEPSDIALAAMARSYAAQIEDPNVDAEERAKRAGWMGPHLVNALKALGGAPAERKALVKERDVRGKLAEMRAARGHSAR